MKKNYTLKHKIIIYVMVVSISLAILITGIMSAGSVYSTNSIFLDNMKISARIASQSISSNLHLLSVFLATFHVLKCVFLIFRYFHFSRHISGP